MKSSSEKAIVQRPMERSRLEPGTVLADKYRLDSVLGVGGMGTVYRAHHLALNAPVAVKVIDRQVADGDLALSRFMREAQAAASLRSPHVVQILDYGTDNGLPYMVMELLEGEPLADRIERLGRLSAQETYRVMHHVAKAVSKAHEAEIVHRDLKPDNVFLVHNEGDEIAKVLDFGVAKVEATALDGAGHTRTGSLLGTPYYMSPEQAQGNKDIDARSDLWALGVIAFECMTGVRPFQSDGLGDLVLQICIRDIPVPSRFAPVPEGFDAWFKKACEREPQDRFQTARELSEALRSALGFGDAGSVPESRWAASIEMRPAASSGALGADVERNSARPTRAEVSSAPVSDQRATEATLFDDSASPPSTRMGRPSNWEVLPHGAPAETQPELERATTVSPELVSALPQVPTRGPSIVTVAFLALLIGGGVVFALNAAGFDVLELATTKSGTTVERKDPKAQTGKAPAVLPSSQKTESKTSSKKTTAPKTKTKDELDPKDPKAADGEKDADPTADPKAEETKSAEGATTETEKPTPPTTEDASLDAVESDAAKTLEKASPAPSPTPSPNPAPKPAPKPSGPEPVLPETLAPAPAPPPPAAP